MNPSSRRCQVFVLALYCATCRRPACLSRVCSAPQRPISPGCHQARLGSGAMPGPCASALGSADWPLLPPSFPPRRLAAANAAFVLWLIRRRSFSAKAAQNAEHEWVGAGAKLSDDEWPLVRHPSRTQMHVATEPVELGHQNGGLDAPRACRHGGRRSPVELGHQNGGLDAPRACRHGGRRSLTVAFHVLVKPDAGDGLSHHGCERGLADLKRLAAEVVVVQLDDVEAVRNTRSSVRF
jgi:hypothetical protein